MSDGTRGLAPQSRVDDEWSRLERVIVGSSQSLVLPPAASGGDAGGQPAWWRRLALGREARARCERELGGLIEVLDSRRVDIVRPEPIARRDRRPQVASQLFVRDALMIIGDVAFTALAPNPARREEFAALASLAPPALGPDAPQGACLDGGDVLVDLPYVFVGIGGHRTNRAGAHYLQLALGAGPRVVCVDFHTAGPAHLDCCLTLTGPGRGIHYRGAFERLPPPLDGYDLLAVERQTFEELGVNVLMVDPGTAVVQARHKGLREALEARGIEALGVDFTQHANLGGAIRCATAPLRRAVAGG